MLFWQIFVGELGRKKMASPSYGGMEPSRMREEEAGTHRRYGRIKTRLLLLQGPRNSSYEGLEHVQYFPVLFKAV